MGHVQPARIERSQLEKMLADAAPRNEDPRVGRALVNLLPRKQFEEEHIPGSTNVPPGEEHLFEQRFDKRKEIVVYCASRHCGDAQRAAEELAQRGFRRVVYYEGGLRDWKNGGHETEGRAPRASRGPTPPHSRPHVTGIFGDAPSAEDAVRALVDAHFAPEEISIIVKDREGTHEEPVLHRTAFTKGAVTGGILGAALGALVGVLAATGVIPTPQLTFFHATPLLAAGGATLVVGILGLAVGAFAGMDSWRDEADIESPAETSGVLISVPACNERAELARHVLHEAGAVAVDG